MIQVRVQYHPRRERLLPVLLTSLAPLPVEVITDPDPGGLPSPWRCYQACLTDLPDCTHLLIIQDDAVVCRNFPAALAQIAAANPDTTVALFVGGRVFRTSRDVRADRRRYVPVHRTDPLPVVATLYPRATAEAFLEWTTRQTSISRSDDAVGGIWMRQTRQNVVATAPSLVEHPDTEQSLIRPRSPAVGHRRAALYIGDSDPLAIDWTR